MISIDLPPPNQHDQKSKDPFMGSGSTIVAAAKTGRRAIGIEKDPIWFEVACLRVADVDLNPEFEFDDRKEN